jgi:hypothetical protein
MATKTQKTPKKQAPAPIWPFGKRNYMMLAIALAVIIVGYIALGKGSITLAPLLLVIGYCVLIPIALLLKDPSRQQAEAEAEPSAESE